MHKINHLQGAFGASLSFMTYPLLICTWFLKNQVGLTCFLSTISKLIFAGHSFGFVRWGMMRLGVGEIGSTGGEIHDGFCHFFIENTKQNALKNLHYLKLFLLIEIYRKCLKSTGLNKVYWSAKKTGGQLKES